MVPLECRPAGQLAPLLSEYLALDRLRTVRRLLLVRCGALALTRRRCWSARRLVVGAGALAGRRATLLLPPAWAWILERRADLRLSDRLRSMRDQDRRPSAGAADLTRG